MKNKGISKNKIRSPTISKECTKISMTVTCYNGCAITITGELFNFVHSSNCITFYDKYGHLFTFTDIEDVTFLTNYTITSSTGEGVEISII